MSLRISSAILVIGLILLRAAIAAWTDGEPSPASFLADRKEVFVLQSQVISGRQNGNMRHLPEVIVDWEGQPTELRGLKGSFYGYRKEAAEEALQMYPAGKTASVRVIDGRPVADRNNWFRIFVVGWLSFFALLLVCIGLVLALPVMLRRMAGKPT